MRWTRRAYRPIVDRTVCARRSADCSPMPARPHTSLFMAAMGPLMLADRYTREADRRRGDRKARGARGEQDTPNPFWKLGEIDKKARKINARRADWRSLGASGLP